MEKIQELTEKIYREGVEKGQAEAANIIQEAKAEAEKIITAAREQAAAIEAGAKKQATDLEQNTKKELKLYTGQALNALKSEIVNIMSDKLVGQVAGKLTGDKDFLNKFTLTLATQWAANESIVISTADAENLKSYFLQEAKELLDKSVTIQKVNNTDCLFTIQPADGSYKVNFGQEEFENYFKTFLRPQLIDMLF